MALIWEELELKWLFPEYWKKIKELTGKKLIKNEKLYLWVLCDKICEHFKDETDIMDVVLNDKANLEKRVQNLEKQLQTTQHPELTLSPRQIQVYKLMKQGLKRAEIAKQLNLGLQTITEYSGEVRRKLGLKEKIVKPKEGKIKVIIKE